MTKQTKRYFVGVVGERWFSPPSIWFTDLQSAIDYYLSMGGKLLDSTTNIFVDMMVAKKIDYRSRSTEREGAVSIIITPTKDVKGTQPYYLIREGTGSQHTYGGEVVDKTYDVFPFKTLSELIKTGIPKHTRHREFDIARGLELKLE